MRSSVTTTCDYLDLRPAIPAAYRDDDRVAIQDAARDCAIHDILPVASRFDPGVGPIPSTLRERMAERGFFGILIPEKYCGLGLGVFEYALVTEELAGSSVAAANIITHATVAARFSGELRTTLLRCAARGEWLGVLAIAESDTRTNLTSVRTRADEVAGGYVINGEKISCRFADQADCIIVVARTRSCDRRAGESSIRHVAVHKEPGSFPDGVNVEFTPDSRGWNLSFDDCFVPDDALLSELSHRRRDENEEFREWLDSRSIPLIHSAARSIGLSRSVLEDSIECSQQPHRLGRVTVDAHTIRSELANLAAEIEACRAFLYQVADDADRGELIGPKAKLLDRQAAVMSERVIGHGMQIQVATGHATDFPIETCPATRC